MAVEVVYTCDVCGIVARMPNFWLPAGWRTLGNVAFGTEWTAQPNEPPQYFVCSKVCAETLQKKGVNREA